MTRPVMIAPLMFLCRSAGIIRAVILLVISADKVWQGTQPVRVDVMSPRVLARPR